MAWHRQKRLHGATGGRQRRRDGGTMSGRVHGRSEVRDDEETVPARLVDYQFDDPQEGPPGGHVRHLADHSDPELDERFEFPTDTPATRAGMQLLERIYHNHVRAFVAMSHKPVPAAIVGAAFGLAERQSQDIIGGARAENLPILARLVMEVLLRMAEGKIPSVMQTPRTPFTQWLYARVDGYRGDWDSDLRGCPWVTDEDRQALIRWHAVFRREYEKWLRR